jgi:hypothetical protein
MAVIFSSSEKAPSSPPCSSSSSVSWAVTAFQLRLLGIDGGLLLGEVACDDERFGHEVAGPALVLGFALLVLDDDAIGLGLPTIGGNQIDVVLHRLGPIVHQVLIDGVGSLGELVDDFLGVAAGGELAQGLGGGFPPGGEVGFGEVIDLHGLQQVLWPAHCVEGSSGAEFAPGLDTSRIDHVIRKGMDPSVKNFSTFTRSIGSQRAINGGTASGASGRIEPLTTSTP